MLPLSSGETEVDCDMTSFPGQVATIIHHNSEVLIVDKGYDAYAGYRHDLIYFMSLDLIR